MRRYQKKIAKEYIELLEQAHSAVRRSMETEDERTVLDLLGQCQEAAIHLVYSKLSCEQLRNMV